MGNSASWENSAAPTDFVKSFTSWGLTFPEAF
jgi:hypothetical protein